MAEPIMRIWQLSEALSRMSKRIQKRYPEEAKILRASSEDIIHHFFIDMRERQEEYVKNAKTNEENSVREQDEKQRKERLQKQIDLKTKDSGESPALTDIENVVTSEDQSAQVVDLAVHRPSS